MVSMGLKPTFVTYTGLILAAMNAGRYPVAYGFFNRWVPALGWGGVGWGVFAQALVLDGSCACEGGRQACLSVPTS